MVSDDRIGYMGKRGFRAMNWIMLVFYLVLTQQYIRLLIYHIDLIRRNKTTFQDIRDKEQRKESKIVVNLHQSNSDGQEE